MTSDTARANGLTVMVVDDNSLMRKIVQIALKRHGFGVVLAEDGPHALAALTETRVDLALIDVALPKTDGVHISALILEAVPQVRILFTSGYSHAQLCARGFNINEADFVPKPTAPAELVNRIKRALAPVPP